MVLSAIIFSVVAVLLVGFHLALLLGAPLGHLTQGGFSKGKLPKAKRIAALIQLLVLIAMAVIVLTKANIVFEAFYDIGQFLIWFVVAVSLLSLVLNTITPSKQERLLGVPVSLAMFTTSLIVALS